MAGLSETSGEIGKGSKETDEYPWNIKLTFNLSSVKHELTDKVNLGIYRTLYRLSWKLHITLKQATNVRDYPPAAPESPRDARQGQ